MTPVSLNLEGPSLLLTDPQYEDKIPFFNSPTYQDSTCISSPTVFHHTHCEKVGKSQHDQQAVMEDSSSSVCGHKHKKEDEANSRSSNRSAKYWKCSGMRMMPKMDSTASEKASNSSPTSKCQRIFPSKSHNNRNIGITRVCADCNTTTTPLWRSGPNGPKSLCNACGIRQRKARKAMAEGGINGLDAQNRTVNNKEKKCQFKNKWKLKGNSVIEGERKFGFKDFAFTLRSNSALHQQVFLPDELVEGALLLMDLSCGFIHC